MTFELRHPNTADRQSGRTLELMQRVDVLERNLSDFRLRAVGPWEKTTRFIPSGSGSTTSSSLVDWPPVSGSGGPLTTTFNKLRGDTLLIVDISVSSFISVIAGILDFAVNVDGTDTNIVQAAINTINNHHSFSGKRSLSGIVAGTRTLKLRASVASGSTLNCDGRDTFSWTIREVLAGP